MWLGDLFFTCDWFDLILSYDSYQAMGIWKTTLQRFKNQDPSWPEIRDPSQKRLRDGGAHVWEHNREIITQNRDENPLLPLPQHHHTTPRTMPRIPPVNCHQKGHMVQQATVCLRRQHEETSQHHQTIRARNHRKTTRSTLMNHLCPLMANQFAGVYKLKSSTCFLLLELYSSSLNPTWCLLMAMLMEKRGWYCFWFRCKGKSFTFVSFPMEPFFFLWLLIYFWFYVSMMGILVKFGSLHLFI